MLFEYVLPMSTYIIVRNINFPKVLGIFIMPFLNVSRCPNPCVDFDNESDCFVKKMVRANLLCRQISPI